MTAVGSLQILVLLALVVAAAIPLGRFIADLFEGNRRRHHRARAKAEISIDC